MFKQSVVSVALMLTAVKGNIGEPLPEYYVFSRPLPVNLALLLPGYMTNQAVSEFHMALEKNTGWLFDKGHAFFQPNRIRTRVVYKYLVYPFVMAPFYKALRLTTDAYGKASRLDAFVGKSMHVTNTYETYAESYWPMLFKNLYRSYKGVFTGSVDVIEAVPGEVEGSSTSANAFVRGKARTDLSALQNKIKTLRENDAVDANKAILNSEVAALREELDGYLTHRGKILLRVAGYNARMAHTKTIEDTLWYDGGGHLAQLSNHTMNKLVYTVDSIGVFFQRNETGQANSDLGRIQRAYHDAGIELSWKEMGIYGCVAFLGSAEFWGRFFEEIDYISTGDTYVRSAEVNGFRLPNIGFYLTSHGPSYQFNTGYRWGQDLFFPVAVEFVFKGPEKMMEFSGGVRQHFAWMGAYAHAEVVANIQQSAFGGKVSVGMKPADNVFVEVGARIDHAETLEGERNIRSLKDGLWCPSVSATVGMLF